MRGRRDSRAARRRHRGPDLPTRTQNRDSFRRNIPRPSGPEEEFARHHAELYGEEEDMVDGKHTSIPHFPRRTERARIHGEYTTSNRDRDRTRNAYDDVFDDATAEYNELDEGQTEYYDYTSDGMLPSHHAALLPLSRAREEPNFQ